MPASSLLPRLSARAIRSMPYISARLSSSVSSPSSPSSNFTYRLAASSAGKRTPPRQPKYAQDFWTYTSAATSRSTTPYLRSTKPDSGEDAFFATTIGPSSHDVAFGVADGVGGWQDQGIDPSEFSHGLCGLMAGTAHIHNTSEVKKPTETPLRPQALLQTAYEAVMSNPRILAGGSTACVAVMDGSGALETANLGDSAYMVFAPGKMVYKSEVQTHAFNTPFQMAKVPQRMAAQYAIFGGEGGGGKHFSETPAQAEVVRLSVRHGDVVVIATDGVWDNLSAQDTLAIITRVMTENGYWTVSKGKETMLDGDKITAIPQKMNKESEHEDFLPAKLATAVMREAKIAGLDRRRNGPFAKEVNAKYPEEGWRGGKPDDIAVVVCVAVDGSANGGQEEEQKPLKAKL